MTQPPAYPPGAIPLACLRGEPAPPDLAKDLVTAAILPASARARLWDALGPSLPEPVPAEAEGLLDAFCETHGAAPALLAPVIKACRFLVREASVRDLPRADLAEDLALLGAPDELQRVLVAGYDSAKQMIRAAILRQTLIEHGRLLVGASYRLDTIEASESGTRLNTPVVMLTLRYLEGEGDGRFTVQVLPETLRQIRALCDQILG